MDLARVAKDTLYVTVGLGVLAVNRAQAARQDLQKALDSQFGDARVTVDERLKALEERLETLSDQLESAYETFEQRIEKALDEVEDRMPETARELVRSARSAAKEASGTLRDLVGREGRAA